MGGGNIMGRGEVRRDIRGDVRDAINEERKIRFSSRPSSQRRFFETQASEILGESRRGDGWKKQRRLNFTRNPFNSPRRGELIGTSEAGININDLVVT